MNEGALSSGTTIDAHGIVLARFSVREKVGNKGYDGISLHRSLISSATILAEHWGVAVL